MMLVGFEASARPTKKHVLGEEFGFDRAIARYAPGSVNDFDLEAFLLGRETVPNPNLPPLEFPGKPAILSGETVK
jgi:hypothetical protein